jgi:hypothetical protein
LTVHPSIKPVFATSQEQIRIVRQMRLLRDDICELSGFLGPLIALSRREADGELVAALNRNAGFWNSVLGALSTSSFVVIGRIHDTRREAYLRKLIEFAKTRPALSEAVTCFGRLLKSHEALIQKIVELRQTIFAHTSFDAPERFAFGFNGLTWDQIEAYWRDLAAAGQLLERSVFEGTHYGPQTSEELIDEDIARANQAFDSTKA